MRVAEPHYPASPELAISHARYFNGDLKIVPGVHLPLRSMLIDGASRILVSPIDTVDERRAASGLLDAIVAPSLLHGIYTKIARDRHRPRAVWGPPGFAAKHPELGPVRTLGVDPWPFIEQLDFEVVAGAPKRQEVVFFHSPSRTIYTADVVFNLGEPEGLIAPLVYRLMGVYKRLAMPKLWSRWITDKAAFRRSMDRILAWDFDRIAVAHGELVASGGHDRFEKALAERLD